MTELSVDKKYTISEFIKEIEDRSSFEAIEKTIQENNLDEDPHDIKQSLDIFIDNLLISKKYMIDFDKFNMKNIAEAIINNKHKIKLELNFEKCLFDISPIFIYTTTEDCDDDKIKFIPFVFDKTSENRLQGSTTFFFLDKNDYSIYIDKSKVDDYSIYIDKFKYYFKLDKEIEPMDNILDIIANYLTYILINIQLNDDSSLDIQEEKQISLKKKGELIMPNPILLADHKNTKVKEKCNKYIPESMQLLAKYCAEHFKKWWNPERYPAKDMWLLAKYCSEYFDDWWDKDKYPVEDMGYLAIHCSKYFDKWWRDEIK